MHRRLGEPLPHQLANAPQGHPKVTPKRLSSQTMRSEELCGISTGFSELSQSLGQVPHVLLTRPPLIPSLPSKSSVSFLRSTCMY